MSAPEMVTLPVDGRSHWFCGRCGVVDDACQCPPLPPAVPYPAEFVTMSPEESARLAALPPGSTVHGPVIEWTWDVIESSPIDDVRAVAETLSALPRPTHVAMTQGAYEALLAAVARDEKAERRRQRMGRKRRRGWA